MIRNFLYKYLSLPLLTALLFLFVYLPIGVLILFSFNKVAFPYRWVGFSLEWYAQLWNSPELIEVIINSCIVALSAVILSIVFGVVCVYGSRHYKMNAFLSLFYINLVVPELLIGVGLLSLFVLLQVPTGLLTLVIGHTILGLGFVIPILSDQFAELDNSVIEASYDLGASGWQTFWRVIVPIVMPGIISAGLLVFVLSFDDFVVSFFCAGPTAQTLPLYLFAIIRTGVSPLVNALSVVLLAVSTFCISLYLLLSLRSMRKY
jgi:spermidine/putrescine transport system permease protein